MDTIKPPPPSPAPVFQVARVQLPSNSCCARSRGQDHRPQAPRVAQHPGRPLPRFLPPRHTLYLHVQARCPPRNAPACPICRTACAHCSLSPCCVARPALSRCWSSLSPPRPVAPTSQVLEADTSSAPGCGRGEGGIARSGGNAGSRFPPAPHT